MTYGLPESTSIPSAEGTPEAQSRRGYVPLLYRIVGLNALLLLVAVVVTIIVLSPHRTSSLRIDAEGAAILLVLLAALAVNVYLIRRMVGPVQALTALASRVDLTGETDRMPVSAPASEAGQLASTFNAMLDRLEVERREATRRVLAGQESERLRIARELHDQVGQQLTAVLLGLARIKNQAAADLQADVTEVQDVVRETLEDVRRIAVDLRPEALDELGLPSALAVLCQRFGERSGLQVTQRVPGELPELPEEVEVVVYRIAQESLTNIARHSSVREADLALTCDHDLLTLTVTDQGRGIDNGRAPGAGIRGMRERALLIGARLTVTATPAGTGCQVRLDVPLTDHHDAPEDPDTAR